MLLGDSFSLLDLLKDLIEKDCRIRTAFSYRFVLDTERTSAFSELKAPIVEGIDPYFYIQEELNYKVKYLSGKLIDKK